MSDSQNLPDRRNIRLKDYDYSKSGLFFITICTYNRECLFGRIENDQMILNDAGQMIEKWFRELLHKYPNKKIHEFVVMPNHFHGIVENVDGILNNNPDAHVDRNVNINFTGKNIAIGLNTNPDAHVGASG